jgi:hypothetical protein
VCGITSVAFSVSGRLLFAGYDDFECKVSWNEDIVQFDSNANIYRCGTSSVASAWERCKDTTIV